MMRHFNQSHSQAQKASRAERLSSVPRSATVIRWLSDQPTFDAREKQRERWHGDLGREARSEEGTSSVERLLVPCVLRKQTQDLVAKDRSVRLDIS